MSPIRYLSLALAAVALGACSKQAATPPRSVLNVYIQPYTGLSKSELTCFLDSFTIHIGEFVCDSVVVSVLPYVALPDSFRAAGNKYQALKILSMQRAMKKDGVVVGGTNRDICTPYHGVDNWGIGGLATLDTNVCVASSHRLKNKRMHARVALHEFIHTYYSAHHCPDDCPTCIMRDANGKLLFEDKPHLCPACRQRYGLSPLRDCFFKKLLFAKQRIRWIKWIFLTTRPCGTKKH